MATLPVCSPPAVFEYNQNVSTSLLIFIVNSMKEEEELKNLEVSD